MKNKEIQQLIENERIRQENEICLIASENYVSKDVLEATGSILINKYAEGYPNRRYYGGCNWVDQLENYAIDSCKKLFNVKYVNVQPHSGSQANQAVYLALLNKGDTILGMNLDSGGHLTHGSKVSSSGKLYNAKHYDINDDGFIDYEDLEEQVYTHQPNLLIVGASAYSRMIDFKRIRDFLDRYNNSMKDKVDEGRDPMDIPYCYFMVDMAHIAGLVAAGVHPSPIPYADVVTSTTHKTLRGARGGLILTNNQEIAKKIDKAVFPGNQGGPLLNMIAGKAVCFSEALKPEFSDYSLSILRNCKAMEEVFRKRNVKMVANGSDNHLILLDLTDKNISGKALEDELSKIGIVVNKNAVKNDPRPKVETSGVRIGTPAITTRGANQQDSAWIASMICNIIDMLTGEYDFDGSSYEETIEFMREKVKTWCSQHPIYGN